MLLARCALVGKPWNYFEKNRYKHYFSSNQYVSGIQSTSLQWNVGTDGAKNHCRNKKIRFPIDFSAIQLIIDVSTTELTTILILNCLLINVVACTFVRLNLIHNKSCVCFQRSSYVNFRLENSHWLHSLYLITVIEILLTLMPVEIQYVGLYKDFFFSQIRICQTF